MSVSNNRFAVQKTIDSKSLFRCSLTEFVLICGLKCSYIITGSCSTGGNRFAYEFNETFRLLWNISCNQWLIDIYFVGRSTSTITNHFFVPALSDFLLIFICNRLCIHVQPPAYTADGDFDQLLTSGDCFRRIHSKAHEPRDASRTLRLTLLHYLLVVLRWANK